MASYKLGFFGTLIRYFLLLVNILFLLIGIVLLVTACVFKWGSSITKLFNIEAIDKLVSSASISVIPIILLVLSIIIIMVSFFGFIGVKKMNRCLMITYEIIVIAIFVAHLAALLVLVFNRSSIDKEIKKGMAETVDKINSNSTSADDFKVYARLSLELSKLYKCCGDSGPADFKNQTLITVVCESVDYKDGCTQKILDSLDAITTGLAVIPSAVMLGIEGFAILTVPFLIGSAKNNRYN
jgi:hypothetical protein